MSERVILEREGTHYKFWKKGFDGTATKETVVTHKREVLPPNEMCLKIFSSRYKDHFLYIHMSSIITAHLYNQQKVNDHNYAKGYTLSIF